MANLDIKNIDVTQWFNFLRPPYSKSIYPVRAGVYETIISYSYSNYDEQGRETVEVLYAYFDGLEWLWPYGRTPLEAERCALEGGRCPSSGNKIWRGLKKPC